MKKTIHKLFWAWQYDKEEKWLNEMAAKGLVLESVGLCKYIFSEGNSGEYAIRMELLENMPMQAESENYIRFIEETGAEYIGSIYRWAYFRKKREEKEFDLYSDLASKIKYLNRILCLLAILSMSVLFTGALNVFFYYAVRRMIFNLVVGMINLTVGLFIVYGFADIYIKKRMLKKENMLYES